MGNHYVPQQYLRGFSDGGMAWVHDRQQSGTFRAGIRVIANEVNMYSPEVEAYLNHHVEGPTHAGFNRILSREAITEADRQALARYILVFWKRVPTGRERALARMPEVTDEVHDELMAELDVLVREDPSFGQRAEQLRLEAKVILTREKNSPSPHIWYESMDGLVESYADAALLSMNWVFLCSKKTAFLTSDNPVFFFEHEGIGRASSELTFPVSSSIALWATRHHIGPEQYVEATAAQVKQINRRTAHNSKRFIFSATNEPWIKPFTLKGHWQIERMRP